MVKVIYPQNWSFSKQRSILLNISIINYWFLKPSRISKLSGLMTKGIKIKNTKVSKNYAIIINDLIHKISLSDLMNKKTRCRQMEVRQNSRNYQNYCN